MAHQYVVSVSRCWYGQVPHWCQAAFAQQVGLVILAATAPPSGARPTAAPGERSDSIQVSAPGRDEAASAVPPSTSAVDEPLGAAAGAVASAVASSRDSGVASPGSATVAEAGS